MATVTRKVVKMDEAPVGFTFTAGVTAGSPLDFQGRDDKTLILLNNTGSDAGTIQVKMGNGIAGVTDLVLTIPASKTVAFQLNSQEFKSVSGEDKGFLNVKGSATTLSLAVVEHL